jgi:hypothetical protein
MTALAHIPVPSVTFDLRTLVDRATTILVNVEVAADPIRADIVPDENDVGPTADRCSVQAPGDVAPSTSVRRNQWTAPAGNRAPASCERARRGLIPHHSRKGRP